MHVMCTHPETRSTTAPHREHTFQPFSEMTFDVTTSSSTSDGRGLSISHLMDSYFVRSLASIKHTAAMLDANGSLQQRTGMKALFVNARP